MGLWATYRLAWLEPLVVVACDDVGLEEPVAAIPRLEPQGPLEAHAQRRHLEKKERERHTCPIHIMPTHAQEERGMDVPCIIAHPQKERCVMYHVSCRGKIH